MTFSLDGTARTLASASPVYFNGGNGPNAANINIPGTPTTAGYTEGGLTNRQFAAGALSVGFHAVTVTFNNDTGGARSLRLAYTRDNGDISDAAAAAAGKRMAIVFLSDTNAVFNDPGGSATIPNPYGAEPGHDLGGHARSRRPRSTSSTRSRRATPTPSSSSTPPTRCCCRSWAT